MKINFCHENEIKESDYINVGSKPTDKLPTNIYRHGDVHSLDWLCEDNNVDEILAINTLGHIDSQEIDQAIQNWFNKLKPNGILKIGAIDIHLVSKLFVNTKIDFNGYINCIWGSPNNRRISGIDRTTLCDLLLKHNFTLVTKRYDGVSFYVEARKNED